MNDLIEKAYWRGFWKTAMQMGMPPPPPAPQRPRQLQQPMTQPGMMMRPQSNPQMAQIQQMMKMMPMQQQQQFEKQLAGQFGMKGQSFTMNPSAK
jgi:hypothetical protein